MNQQDFPLVLCTEENALDDMDFLKFKSSKVNGLMYLCIQ